MSNLKEAVDKTEGVVSKVGCSVSRKLPDGSYGSFEVSTWMEMDLAPDADFDEAIIALDAYLESTVGQSAKRKQDKVAKPKQEEPVETIPMVPAAPQVSEPEEKKCNLHGVMMKKYTKEGRSWYSHKYNDVWCKGE